MEFQFDARYIILYILLFLFSGRPPYWILRPESPGNQWQNVDHAGVERNEEGAGRVGETCSQGGRELPVWRREEIK